MQTPHATVVTRFSTAALIGIGALAGTGCNSGTPVAAAPSTAITAAAPGVAPIAVNCGPGQQALIRPSLVAGQTISQVDCVPVSGMPGAATVGYPGGHPGIGGAPVAAAYYDAPRLVEAPVAYRPAARPVSYRQASAPRAVRAEERTVVEEERAHHRLVGRRRRRRRRRGQGQEGRAGRCRDRRRRGHDLGSGDPASLSVHDVYRRLRGRRWSARRRGADRAGPPVHRAEACGSTRRSADRR